MSCENGTPGSTVYCSPVRVDLLGPFLDAHPDQAYASYIANGLQNGFRIGFIRGRAQLRSRNRSHPSCHSNPTAVQERLTAELASGHLLGPIDPSLLPAVHISPMGLVPKPHQPNKFRLIVDLSSPSNKSVNDRIPN